MNRISNWLEKGFYFNEKMHMILTHPSTGKSGRFNKSNFTVSGGFTAISH